MQKIKAETKLVKGQYGIENLTFLSFNCNVVLKFLFNINRNVRRAHVVKLKKLIEKNGCTRAVIIAWIDFLPGESGWYIIDGQHLYKGLEMLERDIPVVQIEIHSLKHLIEAISEYNTSASSWDLLTYILAWRNENKDYDDILNAKKDFNIETSVAAAILMQTFPTGLGGNKKVSNSIKSGNFKTLNLKLAKKQFITLNKILDLFKDLKGKVYTRRLISESARFIMVNKDYNEKALLQFCLENKIEIMKEIIGAGQISTMFQKALYENF